MALKKTNSGKRGGLTVEEKEFIIKNKDSVSAETIARRLNRDITTVTNFIIRENKKESTQELNIHVQQLRASPFWPATRAGLLSTEVAYFESQWSEYMEQFTGVAMAQATDYMMIKDVIIFDIMFLRAMAEKTNAILQKRQLESRIASQMEKPPELRDMELLRNDNTVLSSLNQAVIRYTGEITEFQQRKDALMKNLKGTREQRFKQIEESRSNIFECIKSFEDKKKRIREGIMLAKVKAAADKVRNEWSQPIEFANKEVDAVYLAPENFEHTEEDDDGQEE